MKVAFTRYDDATIRSVGFTVYTEEPLIMFDFWKWTITVYL